MIEKNCAIYTFKTFYDMLLTIKINIMTEIWLKTWNCVEFTNFVMKTNSKIIKTLIDYINKLLLRFNINTI